MRLKRRQRRPHVWWQRLQLEPRWKTLLQLHRAHLLCLLQELPRLRVLVQNRAEKYLPFLPMREHQGMNKGRMREVETWHAYLRHCHRGLLFKMSLSFESCNSASSKRTRSFKKDLADDVAARSAKLYHYLTQSLSRWERGQELLRSCSKRQSLSACGYEAVRTITQQYSIVSRMEAVYVREQCLKLATTCQHHRRPTDLIRHLEDEFSRAESKLGNFPELRLTEADRCSVLLQALSQELRQYVVLHGKSNDWTSLSESFGTMRSSFVCVRVPFPQIGRCQEKVTSFVTTADERDTWLRTVGAVSVKLVKRARRATRARRAMARERRIPRESHALQRRKAEKAAKTRSRSPTSLIKAKEKARRRRRLEPGLWENQSPRQSPSLRGPPP
ncbi:unnamed protein product [Symbiodinium natans]|uniref:Uncharacterized protein n=1 Tax=Symbiodinium natans TaxID=878477 RepID=A0A812P9H9_9DINO|nr:unnamed protein product [Symbiodinium natans]